MGKLSALDEPENKLKEAIQEENEFIAIPVVSHLTQTMGEWLGLYIGVIGTLCSVVIAILLPMKSDTYCRYLPVCSS